VREQAMVGHADANVDGEEVHDDEGGQVRPGEEEERGDGSDVEEPHGDSGDPVDAALLVLAAHAEVLLDLLGDFGDGWDYGGQLGRGLCGSFFDRGQGSHVFSVVLNFYFELLFLTLTGAFRAWCKTFVMLPKGVSRACKTFVMPLQDEVDRV
jgi:hypothetical protein